MHVTGPKEDLSQKVNQLYSYFGYVKDVTSDHLPRKIDACELLDSQSGYMLGQVDLNARSWIAKGGKALMVAGHGCKLGDKERPSLYSRTVQIGFDPAKYMTTQEYVDMIVNFIKQDDLSCTDKGDERIRTIVLLVCHARSNGLADELAKKLKQQYPDGRFGVIVSSQIVATFPNPNTDRIHFMPIAESEADKIAEGKLGLKNLFDVRWKYLREPNMGAPTNSPSPLPRFDIVK